MNLRYMMCQYRVIIYKYTTLGESMHVRDQGIYGKSLYLPLNFAVNLKLLKKKKKSPN